MKHTLAFSALLMLLYTVLIDGINYSNNTNNGPKICVLDNCDYYSVNNVCGRYGGSNLCKRFNNSCLLRYEGCVNRVNYDSVSLSMCSGIPVGTRRQCSGSGSGTNTAPIYISRRRG